MRHLIATILIAATLAGCVGAADDAPAPDGGAAAADATVTPDARAAADAAAPADAELLEDCALACAGEDLSQWSGYTICRPSYRHCAAAPLCAEACAPGAALTCSSPTNCQCDVGGVATTCVLGGGA